MKKITLLLCVIAIVLCCTAVANAAQGARHMETRIRIVFNNEETVVALFDNPVSKDFVSLLPMTVTFKDYARTEKITYLSRKLDTQGGITGGHIQGDFTYYAPWGNLAVFYKGFGNDSNLYLLGRIESGKEKLAGMTVNFSARIEIMK